MNKVLLSASILALVSGSTQIGPMLSVVQERAPFQFAQRSSQPYKGRSGYCNRGLGVTRKSASKR
jgi:hypothetical protein